MPIVLSVAIGGSLQHGITIVGKAEGRRQKAEGRRQKAEGRRQKAKGRRQKAKGRKFKTKYSELLQLQTP
ncbi:MAG: hypothetical protein F6K30_13160 [Cyanothece sp. SIO2G6]|nr:hypothetical protein [Cyanothece sp. SIO2G6]